MAYGKEAITKIEQARTAEIPEYAEELLREAQIYATLAIAEQIKGLIQEVKQIGKKIR